MEILTLVRMVRRRWWVILLPVGVLLALLLPSLPRLVKPPMSYTTAMRFTAAAPSDVKLEPATTYEDSVYVPWLASEYVVVNLPQWITSDSFAREVSAEAARNGVEIAYQDVRPAFAADAARSILVVYIHWDDPAELQTLAEAAVIVLKTRNQLYFPQFAAYPAEVVALDDVRVNAVPPPLMSRFEPLLRLAIALGAGLGLAAMLDYFDDTIRTPEDIQSLGLEIFSVVPGKS